MTHVDGGHDEELYGAMRSAIGAEPPMAAQPHDDLARGRRRLLHRRVGTALAVGAVVPAVALVASVVPDGTSADGGAPGFADASTDEGSPEDDCGWFSYGEGDAAKAFPVPAEPRPAPDGDGARASQLDEDKARLEAIKPPPGPTPQSSDGGGGLVPDDGSISCDAVPVEPVAVTELDRLEAALTETLDPSSAHLSMMMSGAAGGPVPADGSGDPGDEPLSQGSVTAGWTDGAREGEVNLSVIDPSVDDGIAGAEGAAPCEDPMLFGGPRLACERRELPDGSTVLVGTGQRDGLERVTVRFERPDGQVVWATADEASSIWREDDSGPAPLLELPVTTQQLIELAQDPRVHL